MDNTFSKSYIGEFVRLIKRIYLLAFPSKANSYTYCKKLIINKSGLEIGGPSALFSNSGLLPLYSYPKNIDNCNFAANTIWEGQIKDGKTFYYNQNKPMGNQYVLDSTNLNKITNEQYDFILSSHVIEHIANPIKALFEWIRVLKNDGILVIIFPHKDGTFDHRRPVTELDHIIDDYNNNISESDSTHLNEILELHDLEMDPAAGSFDQFKLRSQKNFENRCLHHHVFNTYMALKLIDFVKLKILSFEAILPFHIIIIAIKSNDNDNTEVLYKISNSQFQSPFKSDFLI